MHAHLHSTRLHGVAHLHRSVYVCGEHAALEGQLAIVAVLDCRVHVLHLGDFGKNVLQPKRKVEGETPQKHNPVPYWH